MTSLVKKILRCHQSLERKQIPHAFGGALALAWCTHNARGTIDIDVNIFVSVEQAEQVFLALPREVKHSRKDHRELVRETQIRLWWDSTPLDIFLNSTPYHDEVGSRIKWETFSGKELPFLCCRDLAVFKAFFNRTKDWADLEEMHRVNTLDVEFVAVVLTKYLGENDERIDRLISLVDTN